ncbi:MAG: DUF4129 domain-containing protein [Prevotella sp.]|nr:DUF4129 domain-containing protein [Prevotella sp.]
MKDSLQIDSAQLAVFQHDPRFDYDRELVGGSQNFLEWLSTVIQDWIAKTFDVLLDNKLVYYTLIILGVLLVLAAVWFIWKKNPKLFLRNADNEALDYELEQDTIYGVDFDGDIREALSQKNYRQAVRLVYLKTLKHLSDTGKIDWQPSKTPTQYMRQYSLPAFAELSKRFIRVRYGNFEADEAFFHEMKELHQTIVGKGGEV